MKQEEYSKIMSDLIMVLCVSAGPEAWDNAKGRIVEVKMPENVVVGLKAIYDRLPLVEDANLAEFESAVINTLILEGLKSKATSKLLDGLNPMLEEALNG